MTISSPLLGQWMSLSIFHDGTLTDSGPVNSTSIFGMLTSSTFGRGKSEAKMVAHGWKFCTSVSVLFVHLHISSSPLHNFNFQILLGSASKTFTAVEMCSDKVLLDQFYIIEYLKGFTIAV